MTNFKHLGKGSTIPDTKNCLILYTEVICPYAQRVHLVLNAKKIPYHPIYINLWQKPEWYTLKSPTGKVPALALPDQTDPLIESLIIADFLDETYPENPLHSKNPFQKAKDRMLIKRFSSVTNLISKIMFPEARNHKPIENVKGVAEEIFRVLDVFEKELIKRGSQHFGGDKLGMVDYMIWPWIERMSFLVMIDFRYGLNQERFRNMISWRDLMTKDEAVKLCYLTPEFFYEVYKGLESSTSIDDLMNDAAEKREMARKVASYL